VPSYPSCATLAASLTKLSTAGRASSARQPTHRAVRGTPRGGGKARLLSDRDEIPQVPRFDVHREHNPNCGASKETWLTMATREA
jgi:hypothetical protein